MVSVGLALVAVGMALMTLADTTSSWTALLPGLLVAAVRHRPLQPVGDRGGARLGAA